MYTCVPWPGPICMMSKESNRQIIPIYLRVHKSSIASEIAIGLYLFYYESPLFYQSCNPRDIKNLKLTGCHMTTAQVQNSVKGLCDCSSRWPNDPFPFKIFLSPLCHLCWLWCILIYHVLYNMKYIIIRIQFVLKNFRFLMVRGILLFHTGVFLLNSSLCH